MQVVEYQPHFWSDIIYQPQILGADPDHSQYYTWLRSGVFSFTAIQRFSNQFHKIPCDVIDQFILYETFDEISAELHNTFNGERYKVGIKVTTDIIVARDRNQTIEFLFDIMYKLVQAAKMELYKKSHYKEELDALWTNQQNMLMSVNGVVGTQFDYIRERIDRLTKEMNFEFERKIMFVEGGESVAQSLRDFPAEKPLKKLPEKSEEETFQEIEDRLNRTAKTLKLSRIAIKNLPKSISNKFLLPLDMNKDGDYQKYLSLIEQPFSFLEYNGAKFSIDLFAPTSKSWDDGKDQLIWSSMVTETYTTFDNIRKEIQRRKDSRLDKMQKLNKVDNKLENHVKYLKDEFEKKAEKYGNDKYMQFIGSRTVSNIKKIRESQTIARNKLKALKNKRFINHPEAFFDRMLKLFLGETGSDIRKDLDTLGYNTRYDAEVGVTYLLFLLHIVQRNNSYNAPVLPIMNNSEFNIGYDNLDMLKVMAGHMFIHTVSISKNGAKPTPPKPRKVRE